MKELVTPNHLGLRIGKKEERVAPFAPEISRNRQRIHANRDRQDSLFLKLWERPFDTS